MNNPNDRFYTPDDDILYFLERYENKEFNIIFDELNTNICDNEVKRAIKHVHLKSGRSAGPDAHLNEFLIHGCDVLLPSFFVIK